MKRWAPVVAILGMGIVTLFVWQFAIIPDILNHNDIFETTSENIGMLRYADNIGDPLSEPIKIVVTEDVKVVETNDNQILIRTIYDYKDILTEESFWTTEIYDNVDRHTREFVDKPGYFMFPHDIQKKDYQAYDIGGVIMDLKFVDTTEINGVEVYEFTGSVNFDVSDTYPEFEEQVFEDYTITTFIEPLTGIELSYNEQFTDYAVIGDQKITVLEVYDSPSEFSQRILSQQVHGQKVLHEIFHQMIPIIIIIITAISSTAWAFRTKLKSETKKIMKLQEREKLKDELMATINHEIRNPLTPILHASEFLLRDKDKNLTAHQHKRIQMILQNAKYLNNLLADFDEIKKLDLRQIKISKTNTDVRKFLEDVVETASLLTDEKNVKISLNVKNSWNMLCDQRRISQVISNLVKNAIDFVPEDRGEIVIDARQEESHTFISVQDNGIGIQPDNAARIFEKFTQVNTPSATHKGSGLGLSVCKGIVEAHGGKIWLDTDYTNGAKINFTIPK